MSLKILIAIGLCFIYTARTQSDENNTTTAKADEQLVEEHTEASSLPVPLPLVNEIGASEPGKDSVIERSSHHHHQPLYHGFWKKKFVWRPRWVKTWKEKKVYVAVWKKMWGPVMLNEWVPIPKPPPGWVNHGIGHQHHAYYVKTHPH